MKKRNRFKNILLISFAVIFIAAAGIGEAWSYFTTYASAKGGYAINLSFETEIHESFKDWTKIIEIKSKEDSMPVYVRARAYCGRGYELEYTGTDWEEHDDGYYYYKEILYGGETTTPLNVKILNIPENPEDGDDFEVVVVYESIPVKYDKDGNPYADWPSPGTGE